MRHRGFTLVQFVVVIVLILIAAAILFPVFSRVREPKGNYCQSSLKQIGLGLKQYIQDYDERLPQVSTGGTVGWVEAMQPYLKSWQIFQCGAASSNTAQTNTNPPPYLTDYYYNARLAGQLETKLPEPALSIVFGEGIDNAGANAHLWEPPFDWFSPPDSPMHRHLEGANYAFMDGHVKWFKPSKITTKPIKSGIPTFAIR